MAGIGADDIHFAYTTDDLAMLADPFDARTHFHSITAVIETAPAKDDPKSSGKGNGLIKAGAELSQDTRSVSNPQ
jgi:hypothetical protein